MKVATDLHWLAILCNSRCRPFIPKGQVSCFKGGTLVRSCGPIGKQFAVSRFVRSERGNIADLTNCQLPLLRGVISKLHIPPPLLAKALSDIGRLKDAVV